MDCQMPCLNTRGDWNRGLLGPSGFLRFLSRTWYQFSEVKDGPSVKNEIKCYLCTQDDVSWPTMMPRLYLEHSFSACPVVVATHNPHEMIKFPHQLVESGSAIWTSSLLSVLPRPGFTAAE